ncbi:MBL fold metallo-hydrolase [Paenibacillus sp. TRM 82003]|nr:MBL fold metallo-hydrolase [Paenibacillus sp. TRM 82003]
MTNKSATTLRFWGGLRTIGGTVVELRHGDARIVFDFGVVYDPASRIFDGHVLPRPAALVRDYLRLGLLHPIEGLYRRKDLEGSSYASLPSAEAYDGAGKTAVFISHLHLDHMAAMGLIAPEVPVYMSEPSLAMYETLEAVGEGVPTCEGRTYRTCRYGEAVSVGDIEVTPLLLDHGVLGACAFHIRTPDGAVLYTGDLRLHGAHPEWTESFIDDARRLGFDVLLMEGTTLRSREELPDEALAPSRDVPEGALPESAVAAAMAEALSGAVGIGVFNFYHSDLDRMASIAEAARLAGRRLVFEPATAYVAGRLTALRDFDVYVSEADAGAAQDGTLPGWKRELFSSSRLLRAADLAGTPAAYFAQNSYVNALELFDWPGDGGVYIHSNGVPLGAFDPAYENLHRILRRLGLSYASVGNSGHAFPHHLQWIADRLDAPTLVPLHSFHPERLQPKSGVQLLPEYDVVYRLKQGRLER